MAGIFKKAMGLFVEFEDDPKKPASPTSSTSANPVRVSPQQVLNAEEFDKFEKHFEKLFDQANLPGPDYYEFMKMMETLEAHIKDEKARLSATYASLTIQGLTKEKLIDTANKYKEIVSHDRSQFEKIAHDKSEKERLTKEITDAQIAMGNLKATITEEETKLAKNKQGYLLACEAMMKKISDDITQIQTTL
jgi:hypothetical protein